MTIVRFFEYFINSIQTFLYSTIKDYVYNIGRYFSISGSSYGDEINKNISLFVDVIDVDPTRIVLSILMFHEFFLNLPNNIYLSKTLRYNLEKSGAIRTLLTTH